ncbi:MAG: exopolysaccharide biosynthesis protein [Candidatus Solibacter usitatus]|nr:exopolysaccharide biosynthesis protein [Candidatus Solibacter usitatus]
MVDIHSHILPGIDDGSRSMEETVEMLRVAREHGTTTIVASPHADTQYHYDPEHVDALIASATLLAGPGIEIVRGCDFHLMFDNLERALRFPERYTINGRCYLLMELSDLTIFSNTSALWSQLEEAGMKIILTHPERNPLLRQRFEQVEEWVSQGRYMQVTAQSLLGLFGQKALDFARLLLDRGLVHFIASDAHDTKGRPPRLDLAHRWVAERYSPRLADLLCIEHPKAAVEGRPLDLSGFPPAVAARKSGLLARLLRR